MSKATKAFGIDATISSLKAIGDAFGIGDALAAQVVKKVDKFASDGEDWADATASDWYDAAPWRTGTLRESISVDTSKPNRPRVYIDDRKIQANAGKSLPTIRKWYKVNGINKTEIDPEDYRFVAEEWAASASKTVDPIEPHSAREMNAGKGSTPFLNSIWDEIAYLWKRRIFNGQ